MIKVMVLDDTGHSELEVETIAELKEKVELKDKFVFVDGKYTSIVSLDGITEIPREVVITDSLIGG
jgi:dihydroxyacetone kinase DhaKLM complex PTS-EIIA-like component DhaM